MNVVLCGIFLCRENVNSATFCISTPWRALAYAFTTAPPCLHAYTPHRGMVSRALFLHGRPAHAATCRMATTSCCALAFLRYVYKQRMSSSCGRHARTHVACFFGILWYAALLHAEHLGSTFCRRCHGALHLRHEQQHLRRHIFFMYRIYLLHTWIVAMAAGVNAQLS